MLMQFLQLNYNQKCCVNMSYFKGTHTICFSIPFYNGNQMAMSLRTNFFCETTRLACSLAIIYEIM